MTEKPHLHETCVELDVPFHDVDLQRVVWHGHYYKYFEAARTKLLRSLDLDAGEIIGEHYQLMVIESSCRHIHSLRYGDRIEIATWFHDIENRLCTDFQRSKENVPAVSRFVRMDSRPHRSSIRSRKSRCNVGSPPLNVTPPPDLS